MSPSCAAHVGTDALSDRYGSPKKSNFLFTERTLQMDKFMSNHRLAEDLKWPSFGDDTSIARANLHCKWSQTGSKQVLSADSPLPIGLKPSDPTGLTATDQEQELCLVVFGQDLMFHFAQGGMWEPSVSDDGQFISLDLLPGSELQEVLQGYRGKGGLTRITLWRQSLPQFNPPVLPFEGSDDVTVEHCLAWFQASQSSCEEQAVITAPYEDLKVPQDLIESISSDNQTW